MPNVTKQSLILDIAETVLIEERLVPTFKFSNDIKDKINTLENIAAEAESLPEVATETAQDSEG